MSTNYLLCSKSDFVFYFVLNQTLFCDGILVCEEDKCRRPCLTHYYPIKGIIPCRIRNRLLTKHRPSNRLDVISEHDFGHV